MNHSEGMYQRFLITSVDFAQRFSVQICHEFRTLIFSFIVIKPTEDERWKSGNLPPALRIPQDYKTIQAAFRNTAVQYLALPGMMGGGV